jgi:CheY-like chemotaxis protein
MSHAHEPQKSTQTASEAEILIVNDDLFFTARIESTLRRLGYRIAVARSLGDAVASAEAHPPALAIVNFGSERINPPEVVRHLKALPHPAPVLGFVSHTWIPQVRPNAMAVGCDLLVANSAIHRRLPQIVARLAPLDGAAASVQEAARLAEDGTDPPPA